METFAYLSNRLNPNESRVIGNYSRPYRRQLWLKRLFPVSSLVLTSAEKRNAKHLLVRVRNPKQLTNKQTIKQSIMRLIKTFSLIIELRIQSDYNYAKHNNLPNCEPIKNIELIKHLLR